MLVLDGMISGEMAYDQHPLRFVSSLRVMIYTETRYLVALRRIQPIIVQKLTPGMRR